MKVSSQFATSHFEELLDAIDRGEEVEILRLGKPGLHLVPNSSSNVEVATKRGGKRVLGTLEGLVVLPTDEEWAAMDKEIEDEMVNAPLTSPDHP